MNFTYAFKCYQNNITSKNVNWLHFSWATLYAIHCNINSAFKNQPILVRMSACTYKDIFKNTSHLKTFQSLSQPYSPPQEQLDSLTHFYTTTQHSPHWLQRDATHSPPQIAPFRGVISTLVYLLHPSTSRPTTPNGIQIQSAVFPQYTGQTDRHTTDADTHTHTDRQMV